VASPLRIREVRPLGETRLGLTLSDGQFVERDVVELLAGPAFDAIRRDPALFRRVRVEAGTVVWPTGADLCPDVVIWGGPPPATEGVSPPSSLRPYRP
jgi:uncharacterized protein DUF2442